MARIYTALCAKISTYTNFRSLLLKDYRQYDHQDFKILSEIGSGGSAAVYAAYWKNTTSKFAIKKITKLSAGKEIINEINLMKRVDFHPNIIKFVGIINECWRHEPDERPDASQVILELNNIDNSNSEESENEETKIAEELKNEENEDDFADCHLSNY
ncbi:hypothetical protein RhiirA4_515154 [Rhizophagus irregularis]|uniref:Protein kinase domain-containing protein n=1 Tax=Rhizophagus irregularis TaxID=588596 RepID=A0A2I1GE53_9GLOM|nr:hypothetical protein RhiirA4_515154 [Rhizophagus irregularis]